MAMIRETPLQLLFVALAVNERPMFASTTYASVLEYIHLRAPASAVISEWAREMILRVAEHRTACTKPGRQGWVGAGPNMRARRTRKHEDGVGAHCGPRRHWMAEYGAESTCGAGEDDDCVCVLRCQKMRFFSK